MTLLHHVIITLACEASVSVAFFAKSDFRSFERARNGFASSPLPRLFRFFVLVPISARSNGEERHGNACHAGYNHLHIYLHLSVY